MSGRCLGFVLWILAALGSPALAAPPQPVKAATQSRVEALARAARFPEAIALAERLADGALARRPLRPETAIAALIQLAEIHIRVARYPEAEAKGREALELAESAFGKHDPRLAAPFNILGGVALARTRLAEAESLFTRALALREDAGMPEHPDVAESVAGLSDVRAYRGDTEMAEAYARRALVLRETARKGDPLRLASSLVDLGSIRRNLNDMAEAEILLRRALALRERHLAPDHPDVAASLQNLARLHQGRGQLAEAETLHLRALAICRRTLGADNLFTGWAHYHLAGLREAQKRPGEAEELYRQALAIFEKVEGEPGNATVSALIPLARLYAAQKRPDEAGRAFARALPIFEEIYGEHRNLPGLLLEHGHVELDRRRFPEAIALFERAVALGDKFPDNDKLVVMPLISLATVYYARGLFSEAEPVARRALEVVRRIAPDNAELIGPRREMVALILQELGRLPEAEAIYREVLADYVARYGEEHQEIADVVRNLALMYQNEDRFAEAEANYERLQAIQAKLYKPEDVRIADRLLSHARLKIKRALYGPAEEKLRQARSIVETSGTPALLAEYLLVEGRLREEQGRYAEAETLMRRALAMEEELHGPGHPETASALNNLAGVLIDLGKYEETVATARRAIAIREAYFGPTHPLVAVELANLANVFLNMGRLEEAEELLDRALKILEKKLRQRVWVLEKRASLLGDRGRYSEAVALQRHVLENIEALYGPDHPNVAASLGNLAILLRGLGFFGEAHGLAERALSIAEARFGSDHPGTAQAVGILASLRGDQHRLPEAEAAYRRAIAIREATQGAAHPDTALAYGNLATFLNEIGRPAEAEALSRRARAVFETALGAEHPLVVLTIANLAVILDNLGREPEAEALNKEGLALREKVLGAEHPDVVLSLNNLAGLHTRAKRHAEALPLLEKALHLAEARLAGDHPDIATVLTNLGKVLTELERYEQAGPILERGIAIREKALGPDHPLTAASLDALAELRERQTGHTGLYPLTERASTILIDSLSRQSGRLGFESDGARVAVTDFADILTRRARAAFWLAAEEPARADALRDEAFIVAQWAHHSAAAAALSQMSSRFAKGEGDLAALVRRRQDLVWRYHALQKLLLTEAAKPANRRDATAERALRDEAHAIDRTLQEIDARLAREFPDYAALANPEPMSLAATQALLRDSEALYQMVIGDRASIAWVVTRAEVRWAEIPIGREGLAEDVETLRCGLDSSNWDRRTERGRQKAAQCWRALGREPTRDGGLPFDLERAHRLHKILLGPFETLIADRHLLIVPSGPLTTLPPHVLVTAPGKADYSFAGYAEARWLGARQAVTVLPSVASLKAARATPTSPAAEKPFVSFANPLLTGQTGTNRDAWNRQSCSALGVGLNGDLRAAPPAEIAGSGIVDVEALRRQDPLPETANEVCAVGRDLGAEEADIHLGERATEARLKALNASGALKTYRILHFATHGLISDETKMLARNLSEPSLMLTPPDRASEEDDGLLTASEVAALSLNAEAAVLSACNTGSASGAHRAEALSGLARAFFYAGTRALLVTHWYVNDQAAVELVTGSFAERSRQPALPLAEALRRAMRASIASGKERAHPAWWAPFVVVTAD